MAAGEAREDACRDYQSSLEDLTFNSKPHINMLTILAEENVQFARDIVTLIEAQIAKASSTEKLPVMYLMDSIVKNVGRDYLAAFAKNIVSTFVNVFEKVDENTRKSLYKLRSTWDDIIPSKKLYALDLRVNQLDPAWPVKPLPPNVNSPSIHVNPKFLNKPEEAPKSVTPAPKAPKAAPRVPVVNAEVQKPVLSQEQIIRQQLLIKQKQLLELQQKKLELELEQTKAQLASSTSSSVPTKPQVLPEVPHVPLKASLPSSTQNVKERVSVPPADKPAVPTRDPRLNRGGQHSTHSKDQGSKKELKANQLVSEPKPVKPVAIEKVSSSTKQDKAKTSDKLPKKETVHTDHKNKAKSPSPMKAKMPPHTKDTKSTDTDACKRDPRLRKHLRDKTDDKPEEIKEKRRSTEKREDHKPSEHRPSGNRSKMANGMQKSEPSVTDADKQTAKLSRAPCRKRSRSRSPKTRTPVLSPKRRERRSPPKRRQRSLSPIPSLLKIGKVRQPGGKPSHSEEFPPSTRDERSKRIPKIDARDSRRQKKSSEERQQDPTNQTSTRSNSEPKENVENWQESKTSKRWRPGWEDIKTPQSGDHQGTRTAHARHRDSWPNNKGIISPRTPKQQIRLSVDANLQIPKELTSASKSDLLNKANERLTLGEISQDEFLVVAHQIRQLFQYQEEKRRCDSWDSPTDDPKGGGRKKPLLSNAELNYYEHKAKLRRTQVQPFMEGFMDMDEMDFDGRQIDLEDLLQNRLSPETGPQNDYQGHDGHRRLDERDLSKGLREDQRSSSYCEPFPLRSSYNEPEPVFMDDKALIVKDNLQHLGLREERRPLLETPPLLPIRGDSGKGFEDVLNVKTDSPAKSCALFEGHRPDSLFDSIENELFDAPRFEKMTGQPVNQPMQRFEGQNPTLPNQPINCQRMEVLQGPPLGPQRFEGPQSRLIGAQMFDGAPGQPGGLPSRFDGMQPVGASRFEGGLGPQRFDNGSGPQNFDGHQRFDNPQRFEGPQRFDGGLGPQRFDPPRPLLQQRFEGPQCTPMRFEQPMRFDTPAGQPMGSMRFDGPHGPRFDTVSGPRFDTVPGPRFDTVPGPRFDGPPGPRFDGPPGPRFDGPPGPRFDGPPGPRFDGPLGQRFDGPPGPRFDPSPQNVIRFDGPMGQNVPRFENPQVHRFENQPPHMPRFDVMPGQPCQRFDGPPGHQTPPRFDGPPGHQTPPRFDGPPGHQTPPRFDGPMQMQPRFDGLMPQRFDGPNQQPRFDGPVMHPGPRFDNLNPPPIGQNVPPFGQTVLFEHQNVFPGQFQRPDQRFDMPQGPGFSGPPAPGLQGFPNQLQRPAGPYFEDNNPQPGPGFVHFNMPVGNMQPNPQFQPMDNMAQPAPFTQEPPTLAQMPNTGVFTQNQPGVAFPNPENHLGQLDVNELFSKLLSTGILKPSSQTESASPQATETSTQSTQEEEEDDPAEDQDVPDITGFAMDDLKQRYESIITRLYTGIQCYSCGMRFTKSQTDVYADHLDWHYRQNRTEKDVSRKITHRRWYYGLKDWIEFEEIADLEERAKSQFFEKVHEEVILKTQEAAKEKEFQSVPAGPAGADEICDICKEQFEQYWDEEEEEWHLKNALRVNEKIFHPSCYEDYKNTSSFLDSTPSPSKTLLENPLSAMLRLVKEEVPDTSDTAVRVKEEPAADKISHCAQTIPLLTEIKPEPGAPV